MHTVFIVVALFLAGIAALFGFNVFDSNDPHTLGWLSSALAVYIASHLVTD